MLKKTLSKKDILEIEAAVTKLEKTTRGEVVPMIVKQASQYPSAYLRAGVITLLGVGTFYGVSDLLHWGSVQQLLEVQTLALLSLTVSFKVFPKFKLLFVTKNEIQHEVDEAAFKAFHQYGVHRTKEGTGILIVIFLEERTVKVLADSGINQLVPPKTWDLVVSDMIAEIRNTHVASAMVLGIKRCGEILSQKIPSLGANRNELNDNLRTK
jgi:putative membrane protein